MLFVRVQLLAPTEQIPKHAKGVTYARCSLLVAHKHPFSDDINRHRHIMRDRLKTLDPVERSRLVNHCPPILVGGIAVAVAVHYLVSAYGDAVVDMLMVG